jgi:cytochrome b6-f complex iron-sulfur subunit
MVIRASDTEVIALPAVCTHAGCTSNFDKASNQIVCPCHGSVFSETGAVIQGPARRPLQVYSAPLANDIITVA